MLHAGSSHFLFPVGSGVLQGCPLSAILFTLAIDPLLHMLSKTIIKSGAGRVSACADDIAIAVQRAEQLKGIAKTFEIFESISGMSLAPAKCVVLLVSIAANAANKAVVRAWLASNLPKWAKFRIENSGVYLGFKLGRNRDKTCGKGL